MGVFDEVKDRIICGKRPVVIEVWRSVTQSSPPTCSSYDFNAEVPRPRHNPGRRAPQCPGRTADARKDPPPPEPAKSKPVDTPPSAAGGGGPPTKGGSAGRSEEPRNPEKIAANGPSARAQTDEAAGRRGTELGRPTRKSPSRGAKAASAARREEEVVELLTSEDDADEGSDSDYAPT